MMSFHLGRWSARFALLVMALALAAPVAGQSRIQPIDRIIAVVNSEVITQVEFEQRLAQVRAQLARQNIPEPPREVLERQMLERMINERVQLQFARETGIRVDDTVLNQALQRIAEGNRMSLPEFRQALERDGVDFNRFREDIRNEIILTRLREREAEARVTVTDAEIDAYFAAQAAAGTREVEYAVSHILVQVPDQATPEQIQARRAKAEQALAELRRGMPFAQVSASYSDAPNALQGGDLGWRSPSRLPRLFVDALATLQPGELSPILRSPNGFHILKLNDKRGEGVPLVVTQTRARHILIRTSELTSEADAMRRLTDLRERIENGADFAELARVHSEDASATRGGDLGWLSPGDTVPEFERAMNALAPGAITRQPVRSPFGWHLIQVLERRQQDVGQDRARLRARMEIRERKADETYQEFVRQLRDRAYVENRLDDR